MLARLGVLPLLLAAAVIVFSLLSPHFLSGQNLLNVARQSTFLAMVAMGQMLALLTGGFDLSVGKTLAITSVIGAMVMSATKGIFPDAVGLSIALGMLTGIAAGTLVGIVNGIGVALFDVSPFMMTLGTASMSFGIALTLTSGVPVYGCGMHSETSSASVSSSIFRPRSMSPHCFMSRSILLSWTAMGRYFYAIGGNFKASVLSGINTRLYLFMAYVLCGFMAAVAGIMLTARLETGEANIGASCRSIPSLPASSAGSAFAAELAASAASCSARSSLALSRTAWTWRGSNHTCRKS